MPATVLALPSATPGTTLDDLDEAGAGQSTVTTVLLVGAPTIADRAAVAEALERVGLEAVVLAVHAPDGHRLLWGECRGGQGLHTYPDLELAQLVDPETGQAGDGQGPDEVVLSQLGMRGSDLLRWRTADLADWRVVVGTSQRRSTVGVLVHVVPRSDVDPSDVMVGVALDVRVAAGLLPTQVVVDDVGNLPDEDRLSRRLHRRL